MCGHPPFPIQRCHGHGSLQSGGSGGWLLSTCWTTEHVVLATFAWGLSIWISDLGPGLASTITTALVISGAEGVHDDDKDEDDDDAIHFLVATTSKHLLACLF